MSDDEYPADMVRRLVRVVLLDEWRGWLEADYLTLDGLWRLRARLDPTSGEFVRPDAALELLRWDVETKIAEALQIDRAALPGAVGLAPDDPSGL
jgi:hypothetical protein